MALDPQIALGFRPPQVNVEVPHPLEQFGQILSLRNMMQQAQLFPLELQAKQLGLQQAQLAYKQAMGLANLFGGTDTAAPTPAPGAPSPVQTVPAPVPAVPPAPSGLTGGPESIPGLPNVGAMPAPPPVPAAAIAPAAAPQTAPAIPGGGIPGLPSWQKMIQVGGASAFPWIKNINEAHGAQLDQEKKQLDIAKAESEDMVRLGNGMTTNEFKDQNLQKAARKGYISWDDVRKYSAMDVNDPRFQAQKDSWGQSALTYDKSLELRIKQAEEDRAKNKEVRDWVDFHNKQFDQEVSDFKGKVGALTDASQFGPLLATGSDRLKAMYGGLVGQPLDNIKIWTGAAKPGVEVPKPTSVTEQETAQAGARAGAEDLARKTAEAQYYAPTTASVLSGKMPLQNVDPAIQKIIMPALIEGGYGQPGTPTATAGAGFGKLISDAERERLGDYDRSATVLQNTLNLINGHVPDKEGKDTDQKTVDYMGPVEGQKARFPYATLHRNVQSALVTQQQQLKKFITNGSLRGLTEKTLDQMFPTITSTPEHATSVIHQLIKTVNDEKQAYLRDLSDKVIPPALKDGPAAPAAPQTPYQTIERTGTPGPRVSGPFTIGNPATPAAAPQAVRGALAGKPAGTYDLRNKNTGQVEHWVVDANGNTSQVP